MYLIHTRLGIFFATGIVSRFSQDPHESHWKEAKHILRYIQGTAIFGIQYTTGTSELVGFIDFDWSCLLGMCYILCMCVWARQIRQLCLTIPACVWARQIRQLCQTIPACVWAVFAIFSGFCYF
jgi:hypothetical protein